ncbi:CpaF family protein [Paenibacillus sp. HJGM_3]|uniref:CpaF family protein n=1 Tax=Paenibacillus sp. HJGM_3 TaxID=3379816 RepID=UPI00385F6BA8
MRQPLNELSARIRERIRDRLNWNQAMSDRELMEEIEREVFLHGSQAETYMTARDLQSIVRRIYDSFRGMDVIQPLLDDLDVTEIMVNSHQEIFIERGGKVTAFDGRFESQEKLEDLIQAIVAKVNRVVNEASPIVDARLPDGSRVHVVLPPIALKGPTLTIRKFPDNPMGMQQLIDSGSINKPAAAFLERLVAAKYNIFISGGTGSGKTTFLNALCQFVPADERIITIEDSAELQIRSVPNWVRLETRNANTEGKGQLTIRDLIRSSLRMRPNRIIVGEVRGAETLDMLQAMNTGHDGSLSTGHANSVADMLSRLETMVLSGADLPLPVVRSMIVSAIDIMVHLARFRDGSRRVTDITELVELNKGEMVLNPLFRYVEDAGSSIEEQSHGALQPTGNKLCRTQKLGTSRDDLIIRTETLEEVADGRLEPRHG